MVSLPVPVGLPAPPGSAAALGAVVDQLAAAGYAAGLTVHLLEPAGVLSGWQGADATVTAAEVGAALAVAADLHGALGTARARLVDHHELWLALDARVAQLRADQRARFADAGARLAVLTGLPQESGSTTPPEALALVAAVAEEDAGRGAEHGALLAVLAEDAAGAVATLAAATQPFGGTGRPGAAAAVTVRLAVQLPGWGEGALAGLGRQAADELTPAGSGTTLATTVARWRPFAALPGFAEAMVGRLGPDGVTWLLSVLAGVAGTPEEATLAGLLADALGGSGSLRDGQVGQVLAAVRLDPDDPDDALDGVAAAMGTVLAAGAGPVLAAVWGRQMLAREARQGLPTGVGGTGAALLPDPVGVAVTALAASGDGSAAALLLGDPEAWQVLLARPWPDGTEALSTVIDLASAAPGGGRVTGSLLTALGQGLAPGSDARVLDDRVALSAVRPAVTALAAGHPEVVLPVLDAAATGADLSAGADTALRGLGHLVADRESAARVTASVRAALRAGAAGAFAGEVAGAHAAVLEYGERVRYALAWAQAQDRAVDADIVWTMAVHAPLSLVQGPFGDLAGAAESVLSDVLDMNGDVEIGPDTGQVRTADDAVDLAVQTLGAAAVPGARVGAGAAARVGFDRTGATLGRPVPPPPGLLDRIDDLPVPDLAHRSRRGR
jgi:hypothetical protein